MRLLIIGTIISFLAIFNVFADETNDHKPATLFGSGEDTNLSGYIGLHMKYSSLDGEGTFMPGVRGGLMVDHSFTIGLAGYTSVPFQDITYNDLNDSTYTSNRHISYGGLYFEYIMMHEKLLHITGNVLLGGGVLRTNDMNNSSNGYYYDGERYNHMDGPEPMGIYGVIEPEISAEVNVTTFMKVGVSVSYRYMPLITSNDVFDYNQNLKDLNLSGLSGGLYFHFGSF